MQIKTTKNEHKNFYPKLLNPIISDYNSYFKIIKLSKNYTPKNFWNHPQENSTIFIKLEKNNDNIKNSH